jgi:hypothetical protein
MDMAKKILLLMCMLLLIGSVMPLVSSAWENNLNDDLIAYYPLEETSGGVADVSNQKSNGTNNGADRGVTGKIGNAYDFELSENDYVAMNNVIYPTGANADFSVSAWIKTESNSEQGFVLSQYYAGGEGRTAFGVNSGGLTYLWLGGTGGGTAESSFGLTNGVWYNIIGIRESGVIKVYVNGVLNATTSSVTVGMYNINSILGSGLSGETPFSMFDGLIDEVGVWDRALSSAEITQLYNSGNGITYELPAGETDAPLIAIDYPIAITYYENISVMNYTYSDANPDSCWYSIDNGATNSTPVSAGTNFTGISNGEGSNTWLLYCNDTYGNQNSTSVTFSVDTIPPAINIVYPTNITYYTNISTLDYTTDGTNCWYSLDGGATNSSVTCGTNLTDLTSNEGANTWTIWTNDSYWTSSSSVLFYKYTIPPTLNIIYPTNTSYNIDVTTMDYSTDGINCWYSTDLGVTNNTISCGTNVTGLTSAQRSNTWLMWANNSFGEIGSSVTFFKDTIAPSVNIVYPLNATYNIDVTTMDYSVDDAVNCWYSLDDGVTNSTPVSAGENFTGLISTEGTNNWRTYCNDSLNNIGNSYVTFYKDTLPPSVNLTNPANNTLTNAIQNFTASASDPSGLKNATFYVYNSSDVLVNSSFIEIDGTPTSANIGTYLQLTYDDTFRWYYEATDIYGFMATSEAFYITIDLEIPTITWYAPSSSVSTSSSPYTINVSVANTHLNTTNVTVRSFSGALIYSNYTTNIGVPFVWLVDAVTLNERTNTLIICAKDEATNEICENKTITLDTIAPSGQSGGSTGGGGGTSPANRSYTPTSPTNFTINASDINGTGISNITITITNETGGILNETTAEGYGVGELFLGFMYNLWYEGVYKWFFKVVDMVGNVFTTGTSSLTYDITAPTGAILHPENVTYDHQITEMNVSFDETNVWDCWYNAGGSNVSLTDVSNKAISPYYVKIEAYSPPDNSITYMNDSSLSTYSFWNGMVGGLVTELNMSFKIDFDRVSNTRFIFDYTNEDDVFGFDTGLCASGDFCYWRWSNNTWGSLGISWSHWAGHFVKNVTLPSDAVDNFGNVRIITPQIASGIGSNFSLYESYITYTQTGRDCSDTTITGLASSEGSNTWKFWVNDSVGFINESMVMFTQDTSIPQIVIHSPTSSYYNTTSVLVNLSATDDTTSINQIWWSIDGGANTTYTTPSVETFTEAPHNLTAWANDSANNLNSTTISFIVDLTPPVIVLNPISNMSTNSFPVNVSISYLITDPSINTCWYDNGENLNESITVDDTTGIGGGSYATQFISNTTGYTQWAMKKFICGNVSKLGFKTSYINTSYYGGQPTTNWTIAIRSVETNEVLVEKDMGLISNLTYGSSVSYREATFDTPIFICEDVWLTREARNISTGGLGVYHNQNTPLRWRVYNGTEWLDDPTSPYVLYHGFKWNGTAWLSDGTNGIPEFKLTIADKVFGNGTLNCSGTSASIPITRENYHTFTIFGKDSSNFTSSDSESFYTLLHTYNQSVPVSVTTEGSVLDFTLDISMTDLHRATAYLVYNGVDYIADSYDESGNSVSFLKTFTIPDGAGSPTGANATWYWRYFVNGSAYLVDNFTTTPQTQLVYSVEIDDCSLYNDTILHFDLNDEALDNSMNVSLNPLVEANVRIVSLGDEDVYWEFNKTWNAITGSICIPDGLLNYSSYRFDGTLNYEADNYVKEFWYIDNATLEDENFALDIYTNRNITLRDLLLDDSQTFLFKYYNENFLSPTGAIVSVLRYYVGEGVYKEVERCLLDDNGECHLHLVEEDVIYKFRVTLAGSLDYLSGDYNAKCVETPCSITLQKGATTQEWDTEHDNLEEGTYHLETDEDNRTVTLSFNLEDTETMQLDVFVYSNVINSPDTLVDSESMTAKTGDVSVFVPLSYGNKTYYAVVRQNGVFVSSAWVDLNESGYHYFGNLGLFLGALLILCLGLIAISSGGWTIAFLILGLIIASVTKLVDMDFYLIMFIVSAGGLIIWRLASRRSL